MEEQMELLNKWVLDELRVVTAAYVVRHTPLNVMQTQKLFHDFLEANNGSDANINATYYLLGKTAPHKKEARIVRGKDLEEAKARLLSVGICNVYSVQACPVKNLETFFNVDWLDEQKNPTPPTKNWIRYTPAIASYEGWMKAHGPITLDEDDQMEAEAQIPQSSSLNDGAVEPPQPNKGTNKEKAIMPEQQGEEVQSQSKKKRSRRILIESDDEEESAANTEVAMDVEEPARTNEKTNNRANEDDLFCSGDEAGTEEEKLAQPKEKTPKKRKRKNSAEDSVAQSQKLTNFYNKSCEGHSAGEARKEKVVETYEDEEGMLVTRVVTKSVEPEAEKSAPSSRKEEAPQPPPKRTNARKVEAAPPPKKGPKPKTSIDSGKQMKISSFFKPK